jgi:hypothetical protein
VKEFQLAITKQSGFGDINGCPIVSRVIDVIRAWTLLRDQSGWPGFPFSILNDRESNPSDIK